MKTYPLCLVRLEEQRTVVIGGGKVAARKAEALLEAGAIVEAISPVFSPEFRALAEGAPMRLIERPFQKGDLKGAFLVIAATDDPQINHAVWEEARRQRCLANVVDDPQHSNFIVPSVIRRDQIKIAITTGGASPALARYLRERLEAAIDPDIGDLADLLAELRPELMKRFPTVEERLRAALALIEGGLGEELRTTGRAAAKRRSLQLLDDLEAGTFEPPDIAADLPLDESQEDAPESPLAYMQGRKKATGR